MSPGEAMNLRLCLLALAWLAVGAASASAATVTFTMDLTGPPPIWKVTAVASLGDNDGIWRYVIPLTGSISTNDHRSPIGLTYVPLMGVGFVNERSKDGIPFLAASQPPLPPPFGHQITGFGQSPGQFCCPQGRPQMLEGEPWTVPLVIAVGQYELDGQLPGFDTESGELLAEVYALGDTSKRFRAQVITRVIYTNVPEPASAALIIIALAAFLSRRRFDFLTN